MNDHLTDTNVGNIEYIRKQDVLNLPQSIERNLRGEVVERSIDVKAIESLPSADVVPVIRCKSCKYSEIQTFRGLVERLCFYNGVSLNINPDDFCCWGARKEE